MKIALVPIGELIPYDRNPRYNDGVTDNLRSSQFDSEQHGRLPGFFRFNYSCMHCGMMVAPAAQPPADNGNIIDVSLPRGWPCFR